MQFTVFAVIYTLYRYYDENDLKKAQLIRRLRSLDFSISEIKEVLEMVNNEADLTYILQEKIKYTLKVLFCYRTKAFLLYDKNAFLRCALRCTFLGMTWEE